MSNTHKNKIFATYKYATNLDHNNTVRLAERDHMPKEVATEMLIAPGRQTNRQRKTYQQARQRVYESVFEPKTIEAKLGGRMKNRTWAQLSKWSKRAILRRADIQTAYLLALRRRETLQGRNVDPKNEAENMRVQLQLAVLNRAIAGLELKAAQLDFLWDVIDTELTRRKKLIAGLQKLLHPESCS